VTGLTIGFVGGVPDVLGGGGLELQMARTADALARLGHEVVRVECVEADKRLDVVHAFHAEPLVWGWRPHWNRNRCPLVVSPVLPIQPGRDEWRLRVSSRVPLLVTTARMRREVIRDADAVVALTEWERQITERIFAARPGRTTVIGNGVSAVEASESLPERVPEEPFLLMVGGISRRKQQVAVARELAHTVPLVVVGGIVGERAERERLEADLRATDAIWLGEIRDERLVRGLQRAAAALVLLSVAEAQPLVLLEALHVGTPVVASDLPAHRELQAAYPGWIELVRDAREVPAAWKTLAARPRAAAPELPTWDVVAARLSEIYERVLAPGRS
jgi:glycosyltransferase involved in cell wall biosynthesis